MGYLNLATTQSNSSSINSKVFTAPLGVYSRPSAVMKDHGGASLADLLSVDLLQEVTTYLTIQSRCALRQAARLFLILVTELTQSQPAFVCRQGPVSTLPSDIKGELVVKPTIGIFFAQVSSASRLQSSLQASLPHELCLIGACVATTVSCQNGVQQQLPRNHGVLSLAHFPEAEASTFLLHRRNAHKLLGGSSSGASGVGNNSSNTAKFLAALNLRPGVAYKAFIIHSTYNFEGNTGADGVLEKVLQTLQGAYPGAAIMGGIVDSEVFHLSHGAFRSSTRAIVGMALAGNTPIQALVSRGVTHVGPTMRIPTGISSINGEIKINKVIIISDRGEAVETSAAETVDGLDDGRDDVLYIGVRSGDEKQPFVIRPYEIRWADVEEEEPELVLPMPTAVDTTTTPLTLKVLRLDASACRDHVDQTMARMRRQLDASGRELLGAWMFSCCARGPRRFLGLHRQVGTDARSFAASFPDVPLAGFYAGGEIGPQAVYWEASDEEHGDTQGAAAAAAPAGGMGKGEVKQEEGHGGALLRRCAQTGDVALQSFTCMFAMLVVPKRESAGSLRRLLSSQSSLPTAVASILKPAASEGGSAAVSSRRRKLKTS